MKKLLLILAIVSALAAQTAWASNPTDKRFYSKRSEHFIFFYEDNFLTESIPEAQKRAELVLTQAEAYFTMLSSYFGFKRLYSWKSPEHCEIYYLPKKSSRSMLKSITKENASDGLFIAEKGLAAGAAVPEQVARRKIYMFITYGKADFSHTLAHEIGHQILYSMTGERKLPKWLAEGVAEYSAYISELIDMARAYEDSPGRETMKKPKPGGNAIYIAFLLNEYGSDAFSRFLQKLRTNKILGTALKESFPGINDEEELFLATRLRQKDSFMQGTLLYNMYYKYFKTRKVKSEKIKEIADDFFNETGIEKPDIYKMVPPKC